MGSELFASHVLQVSSTSALAEELQPLLQSCSRYEIAGTAGATRYLLRLREIRPGTGAPENPAPTPDSFCFRTGCASPVSAAAQSCASAGFLLRKCRMFPPRAPDSWCCCAGFLLLLGRIKLRIRAGGRLRRIPRQKPFTPQVSSKTGVTCPIAAVPGPDSAPDSGRRDSAGFCARNRFPRRFPRAP